MNSENFSIVGDMADKIKNNVKSQVQQFSWKLTFTKDVVVDDIDPDRIMILNKNLKRLRTEFVVYPKENAVLISPQTPYKPGADYFFWAKCLRKEVCVAFIVTADNRLHAYDHQTSMEKLNARFKREAKRTVYATESAVKSQAAADARANAKSNAKAKANAIIEDEDEDYV